MEDHNHLYFLAAVPLLGVAAQWLAWRFRLPSILLLLAFGVALGAFVKSGEEGEVVPSEWLFPIVSLSVALILFEGGLTLQLRELGDANGRAILQLVTVGALVSWFGAAITARFLFDVDTRLAALVGAVLVVTGPTVVAPLLRHIRPSQRIASVVKWEGIVIDPIGAVLAVLVFEFYLVGGEQDAVWAAVTGILKTVGYGGGIGLVTALLLVQIGKRYLAPDFLQSPLFLAAALGAFSISNYLQHESGLVAVTVMGVYLANQKSISVQHVVEFKENLQVLLIACLFVVLGARIDLASLRDLGWRGLAFLVVLIFVVRPLAVWISTLGAKLTAPERVFLSFLAPRGIVAAAVASVFALKLTHESGVSPELAEQAEQLAPVTFLVIIGTVAFYGLLAAPLARKLGLSDADPQGILFAGAESWIREIAKAVQESGFAVVLVDTNYSNVAAAKMDGMRAHCSSILSEYVEEEIDLSGVGRLLSVTPNDEVNALAVREYTHLFGRANVYQLTLSAHAASTQRTMSDRLRGRVLFGEEFDHHALKSRFEGGAQVKTTQLSEEFSLENYNETYPRAQLLFLVDSADKLHICPLDGSRTPVSGDTLIALVR